MLPCAAVLSLALLSIDCALWWRSTIGVCAVIYRWNDADFTHRVVYLESFEGTLSVYRWPDCVYNVAGATSFAGYQWHWNRERSLRLPAARIIALPYWLILPVALIPPITWTVRRVRLARRQRIGHCLACGYDMRATPDRCPECGTSPS